MNSFEITAHLQSGRNSTLPSLQNAILDCGGWIAQRDLFRSSRISIVLEFPRDICMEIYGALVGRGLELTARSHRSMSELCRCTPFLFDASSREIAVVDSASLAQSTQYLCSLEIIRIDLTIHTASESSPAAAVLGAWRWHDVAS